MFLGAKNRFLGTRKRNDGAKNHYEGTFAKTALLQTPDSSLGACAMTTKFLGNKICTFKILLSWRFPRKNSVLDDFPLCHRGPPPVKNRNFYFYCRLAVSDSPTTRIRWKISRRWGWGLNWDRSSNWDPESGSLPPSQPQSVRIKIRYHNASPQKKTNSNELGCEMLCPRAPRVSR